jgi:hypothetical protein
MNVAYARIDGRNNGQAERRFDTRAMSNRRMGDGGLRGRGASPPKPSECASTNESAGLRHLPDGEKTLSVPPHPASAGDRRGGMASR